MSNKGTASKATVSLLKNQLGAVSCRGFMERLGIEYTPETELDTVKGGDVTLWQDLAKNQENALVLKDKD